MVTDLVMFVTHLFGFMVLLFEHLFELTKFQNWVIITRFVFPVPMISIAITTASLRDVLSLKDLVLVHSVSVSVPRLQL